MVIILYLQYKIDGIVYGLESTREKVWVDHIATRVKETLSRLYDEYAAFRGVNTTSTTTSPILEVKMVKKPRWA